MALDPRIALAIKSPTLDLSGVVNAVRDRRNFNAQQEQQKVINEQNAQQLAMQKQMQDANLANIQSQIGVRQAAEQRAQAQELRAQEGFDIEKQQLNQAQIQKLAQDNAIKAKNALDAGNIDLAKDLFAQTSNAIANSTIDENIKQSALSETNSLLLGLNTGKEDMVKQQLGQAIGGQKDEFKTFAPIDLEDGGKGIPTVNLRTREVTIQPIEGSVSSVDLQKAKEEFKTDQKIEEKQRIEQETAEGQAKIAKLEAEKTARENKLQEAKVQKDLLSEELTSLIGNKEKGIEGIDVSNFTGNFGRIPFNSPETQDELNRLSKFLDNLTVENLSKMSGPKTDKDIALLASAASGIQIVRDENGIPVRVAGSEEGVKKALRNIQTGLNRINKNLDTSNFRNVGQQESQEQTQSFDNRQQQINNLLNKYK